MMKQQPESIERHKITFFLHHNEKFLLIFSSFCNYFFSFFFFLFLYLKTNFFSVTFRIYFSSFLSFRDTLFSFRLFFLHFSHSSHSLYSCDLLILFQISMISVYFINSSFQYIFLKLLSCSENTQYSNYKVTKFDICQITNTNTAVHIPSRFGLGDQWLFHLLPFASCLYVQLQYFPKTIML